MIQDRYLNRNVDTDDILLLLSEWDSEYFMDTPSTFYMREYYDIKSQSHNPDTAMYMEALSGENTEEYFNTMGYEIQSLMRKETWEIFQGIQLLITMCFQEHCYSSARVNLIGQSGNSRRNIV